MHRSESFGAFIQGGACSPTGGDRGLQQACGLLDFFEGLGMDHTRSNVEKRLFGIKEHTAGRMDL